MGNQAIITKLLARMDKCPGFAGLGASIQTISQLIDEGDGGGRKLAASILRDPALTVKLLRLANSSHNARGGRSVSTVDQAIVILGLNRVKSVAMSLTLLKSLSNKPQSNQLHAEIVSSYFCGIVAASVTSQNAPRFSAQQAQICGLLQNLGRMMVTFYLYEEVERSRALQAERNIREQEAVSQTLGVGYGDIGAAMALHWNFPDVLQHSLAPMTHKVPPRATSDALSWFQLSSVFARRVTDAVFRLPENWEQNEIAQAIEFFRTALSLKTDETRESIDAALAETEELLSGIAFPCNVEQARNLLRKGSERVQEFLSADDRLTRRGHNEDNRTPIQTIQQSLRMVHDACGFDRTLLCVPSGATGLSAIAGVGRNANQITARFRCQGPRPDIFRVAMSKKVDLYIADVQSSPFTKLIPDWHQELTGARAFALISLAHQEQFMGMIYGDYAAPQANPPTQLSTDHMKDWRDQLISALKSGSVGARI